MAVDITHLYAVKNELQNAADAGALAGAQVLYNNLGTSINTGANDMAGQIATANKSEGLAVEVDWNPIDNSGDVQRGHWSFATRTFTANASTTPTILWGVSNSALDADVNFINAVRVRTKRESSQAHSFFAKIFGFTGFEVSAEAVAYIGFAGKINPTKADQPIAICRQSIVDEAGNYSCNTGRMLNSGSNAETHNTAAWTNFTQPCDTANANSMRDLVCAGGNPLEILYGSGIGTTGGTQDNTIRDLRTCFGPTTRIDPWNMTLPVIDCPGNNPGNCSPVIGTVEVSVVWISDKDADTEAKFEAEDFPPSRMGDWTPTKPTRVQNWDDFVSHFNLKNVDGITATYAQKSIYFLPSCEPHEPSGSTGGPNFGVLAKIPVLVN